MAFNYGISPNSYFHFDNPFPNSIGNGNYESNYNYKEFDENLERNKQLYFEKMLEIDYDNFMVSFRYYNKNEIYNLFNETLKFDYDYINLKIKNENKDPSWINNYYYLPYSSSSYFLITQIEKQLPYKEWKGLPSKEFRRLTNGANGIDGYYISKILTKDEYINKIVRVVSVSPKIFI